jgi:N-acyl-D-amino-acid deacylase
VRGVDVLTDVPPTWHASGGISGMLPHWIKDGGFSTMLARFQDSAVRSRVRHDVTSDRGSDGLILVDGHFDQVWVSDCPRNSQFSGKSLAEIARLMGQEPSYLTICDLLTAEGRDLHSNYTAHDEGDIQAIVAHPLSMIESDARIPVSTTTRVNTRTYAAFPITFRRYVRGESWPDDPQGPARKILTLQEAVRKMTSMPAQRMGLRDRGLVREGMWADLVIFDPDTIADQATAAHPHQYPIGIDYVLVNGQVVVEKSKQNGKRPGQVLRHA